MTNLFLAKKYDGQNLNMSIYITNKTYIAIPNMNLTKFEPLKPSRSGDSLIVF